jgi:hypothetical protein
VFEETFMQWHIQLARAPQPTCNRGWVMTKDAGCCRLIYPFSQGSHYFLYAP